MLAETYEVLAVSSSGEELHKVAEREGVRTCAIPMERHIAPLKDLIALIRLIILFRKEKPADSPLADTQGGAVGHDGRPEYADNVFGLV